MYVIQLQARKEKKKIKPTDYKKTKSVSRINTHATIPTAMGA